MASNNTSPNPKSVYGARVQQLRYEAGCSPSVKSTDWRSSVNGVPQTPRSYASAIGVSQSPSVKTSDNDSTLKAYNGAASSVKTYNSAATCVTTGTAYQPAPEPSSGCRKIAIQKANDVGRIINLPLHEHYSRGDPSKPVNLKCIAKNDALNCKIFTKRRYAVVVAVYNYHFVCLPFYTHNGQGLQNKSESAKLEYITVKDSRKQRPVPVQSDNGVVHAIQMTDATFVEDLTTIWLTRPHSIEQSFPVSDVGRIGQKDMQKILSLIREKIPRS